MYLLLHSKEFFLRDNRVNHFAEGILSEDIFCGFVTRISHAESNHEAIHLRFGKTLRTGRAERILRSDNNKRFRKIMCLSVDGHLTLFHQLKQCGLCLRRSTVYLICEQQVAHCSAVMKLKLLRLRIIHVKAGNVTRHYIRSKLNAMIAHGKSFRDRQSECSLPDTRNVLKQNMTAGKHGAQYFDNNIVLAFYVLFDFINNALYLGIHYISSAYYFS